MFLFTCIEFILLNSKNQFTPSLNGIKLKQMLITNNFLLIIKKHGNQKITSIIIAQLIHRIVICNDDLTIHKVICKHDNN